MVGIEIGITGFDAASGKLTKEGYDLAAETINKGGGVFVKDYNAKIPIELVYVDDESDPGKAIARAEELNSRGVVATCGTTMISAAADIFEKNKLPCLNSLATINALFQRGFKYWFHIGKLNSDVSTAALACFSNAPNKPTKYALFEEQMDFVGELFGFFRKDMTSLGLNIAYEGKYATGATDMTPLINGAKNANADVIVSAPNPGDGITMLKQMAQTNYKPKGKIMIRAADDPAWGNIGPLGDYSVGVPDWHPSLNFPGVQDFVSAFKAKYGKDALPGNGIAYSHIQVIANAVERAGSLDREKFRAALASTDMTTIAGPIKFGPNGQQLNPPAVVVQWQNGVNTLVWPDNMKTKALVYPVP